MALKLDLPNLLIVGAAKSGTTSLHNYLKQHPQIYMSDHKEPHFLINSEIGKDRIHKAILKLEDYKEMFKTQEHYLYKGESSVMYLAYPQYSIKNIRKYLSPKVKIIIMLRNPVERAFAGYLHNLRYNPMEDLTFDEALNTSEQRYKQNKNISPDTRYLHVGRYFNQVSSFLAEFKDNVHIILYDDYVEDINNCLEKVFEFLEVENIKVDTSIRHMQGGWKFRNKFLRNVIIPDNKVKSFFKMIISNKKIRSLLRKNIMHFGTVKTNELNIEMTRILAKYYQCDIKELSHLINRDLSHWLKSIDHPDWIK